MFIKTKKKSKRKKHKESKKQGKKARKKKERERINQSEIEEEQRKMEKKNKFFGPNNVWRMCKIVKKKKRRRRGAIVTWLRHGGVKWSPSLVTNQIFVSVLLFHTKQKKGRETERGKAETTKAKFPTKIRPYKVLLIHDDYAYYLWFDGKWFAKSIYDIFVVWN